MKRQLLALVSTLLLLAMYHLPVAAQGRSFMLGSSPLAAVLVSASDDAKDKEAKDSDAKDKARKEDEARANAQKEADRKDREAKDAAAKEQERKERDARVEAERKDREAKDAAARDKDRKDAEARDSERRDKERKEQEARLERERKDREAKDAAAKEQERRDREFAAAQVKDRERREAEAKDSARREQERVEQTRAEAERRKDAERLEAERRDRAAKDAAAKDRWEPKNDSDQKAKDDDSKAREARETERRRREAGRRGDWRKDRDPFGGSGTVFMFRPRILLFDDPSAGDSYPFWGSSEYDVPYSSDIDSDALREYYGQYWGTGELESSDDSGTGDGSMESPVDCCSREVRPICFVCGMRALRTDFAALIQWGGIAVDHTTYSEVSVLRSWYCYETPEFGGEPIVYICCRFDAIDPLGLLPDCHSAHCGYFGPVGSF